MTRRDDADRILDRAVEQIRSRRLPADRVEEISTRVWKQLSRSDAAEMAVDGLEPIRGCSDYQSLIPAFLAGTLPGSRRLLLEGHVRECVPCRKALQAARNGEPEAEPSRRQGSGSSPRARWAVAAMLAIGLALAAYWASGWLAFEGRAAMVEASPGELFRVQELSSEALARGAGVDYGERIRTGRGESARLRLEDGSLIEVRERSWLAVRANRRGTTIDLERGSVIVQAAEQGDRHLFVATGECLVAVKGTIFAVNHGTKGSRVSVIEGAVTVDAGGVERLLEPGQQAVTHSSLAPIPVSEDISWSQDVDRYLELMREVSALRRALTEEVPKPDLRYSSRLLDLVPADTAFFVALPNLAETVAEADRILRERVAESRLLRQWLASRDGMERFAPAFARVTERLAEFGGYLGEEVLVTARLGSGDGVAGEIGRPLVLAELRDAAGLRRFIESEAAVPGDGRPGSVAFLESGEDPTAADADLYVWMGDDTLLAASKLETLREALAVRTGVADRSFAGSDFGRRVQQAYAEGAGVLIAADLERFTSRKMAKGESAGERRALEATGVLAAEHLMLEQKWVGGRTQHRAVLGFDGPRRGMASWLAAPGPMGSLEFVSPDAKFAAALLLVEPAAMLEDVMGWAAREDLSRGELEETLGIDLRSDIGAAFGGEIALAIDGPLLPEPSWKLILEVYDPGRAEWVLERLVEAANAARAEEGEEPIELERHEVEGRAFWSLDARRPVHLTYEGGYLLIAPSRALLDRAIRYRSSGYTLATSNRFRGLMPTDGRDNFSALFYQDVVGLLEPLAQRIASGQLSDEQRRILSSLAAENGPSLGYAYAEPERILFAASSTMSLLDAGLPALLGFGNPFEVDGLLRGIVDDPRADLGSGG